MKTAEIHTNKGVMKIEFFENDAPGTVANFVKLASEGFYDGLTFHRVVPNFVIQGGCPEGTGMGGPGYTIPCEVDGDNQYHDLGVLSMARTSQPNTGGSQFFICLNRQNTQHLDRQHTVFGKVVEGLDVIGQISQGDKMNKVVVGEVEA
ncbi:peptidyl-prolyl cis-trans isomerase [marine bacterium AO1-C]|nr:peptidyl-prolyl cis-trans isomerase [marine bacterium AO1-C]